MDYQNTDDALPSMVGFEVDTLGADEHLWRSSGYILSDRALYENEYIFAWLVRESDGKIISRVPFKADQNKYRNIDSWPAAFMEAINALPLTNGNTRLLQGGHFQNNGALTASSTSSGSFHFGRMKPAEKSKINRLWYYDKGYRLFTSAPFIANQVIALRLPNSDLPAGDSLSIQVRDRTSLHLYETHLYTPTGTTAQPASVWSKIFCQQINEKNNQLDGGYGMLRAGVLGDDKISINPASADNALWTPQCSNLSVELEFTTWQKYATLVNFIPVVGTTIKIFVYDRYCTAPLPGSPLSYKITDTDSTKCLAALAAALNASALGRYVKLDEQNNKTLSVIGLPFRIAVLGLPGIGLVPERALETRDGKPLSLDELYERFADGVFLSLNNRSNGHTVHSQVFVPDNASKATKQAWVKALSRFLHTYFFPVAPFAWSGEWDAQPHGLNDTDQIDEWTLWLPAEMEMVLVAGPWVGVSVEKRANLPLMDTQIIFMRDKLACEEGLIIGCIGDSPVKRLSLADVSADILKLASWKTDQTYTDLTNKVKKYLGVEYNSKPSPEILTALHELKYKVFANEIERSISSNQTISSMLSKVSISAFTAARTSQHDITSQEVEFWSLKIPLELWIEECVDCTTQHLKLKIFSVTSPPLQLLQLLNIFKTIDALHLKKLFLNNEAYSGKSNKLTSEYTTEFNNTNQKIIQSSHLAIDIFKEMNETDTLQFLNFVKNITTKEATQKTDSTKNFEITNATILELIANISDIIAVVKSSDNAKSKKFVEALTPLKDLAHINLTGALQDVIKDSNPPRAILELKLSPEACAAGIQFVFYKASIEGVLNTLSNHRLKDGLYLHIPSNTSITKDFPLARASYITEAGIVAAATSSLTIDPPIKGLIFKPADSLCADYANTLGSEVYDVSGAAENGVDPRTGLFHAHYPVGVIRGLSGKGPDIDLSVHYSATRANEGGLGDGWAWRFSCVDNRLHRLTLFTGQTITLTTEHIEAARAEKTLRINGISLTNAKGPFDKLTGLTVVFPTGRREVLAIPTTSDGIEASDHYKKTFVKKLETIEQNLRQWLKETEITTEQTDNINKQLGEIDKLKADMGRTALILIPSAITSPQGGTLTLEWIGKQGHIQLAAIKDGGTTLLSAAHDAPVASGEYGSTFTVWPGTEEEYSVKLAIKDCLLIQLTRQGKTDTSPTQKVVFGYCDDPVLDRVLTSVMEEDGSLETVSYASTWNTWNIELDRAIPLPQVARHTLVPGAGQPAISHTWHFEATNHWKQQQGSTCSSTQMLDNGDGFSGPFERNTWTLKNGYWVLTETVEETPDYSRTTTNLEYNTTERGNTLTAKYRWLTQPIKTSVTTEDLRPAT